MKAIVMRLLFLTMQNEHKYIRWAEWLLAIAAMGYLVYRLITYKQYGSLCSVLPWQTGQMYAWLGLAFVLIPLQLLVEVVRWRYVLRGWQTISIRESWSEVMLGMLAGFITPYRSGDIPARLVACGLNITKEEFSHRWHQWLRDWHKWFAVAGYTVARHLVWGIQLWAVLAAVGVQMPVGQGIISIALYYVLVSVIPQLPVADVAMKGGWAVWIFGQYTDNVATIMLAVSIIWIFNTIIPVLFGSIEKILYFCKRINVNANVMQTKNS